MTCTIYKLLAISLVCVIDVATQLPRDTQTSELAMSREQVLDHWAEALGGRQNLQNVAAIHLRGSIESGGMKGTYERWTTARGSLRTAVDLSGAFRRVNVFDGHNGWTLDNSGAVHEISGETLSALVSSAYEASESFLFPGRIPGNVELVSDASNQDAYVLRLEPQNGDPLTVYLDAQTFLPQREESSGPMGKRIISLSDWRTFGGVKLPGTVRQSNGDPKYDAVITTEQVEINPSVDSELFEKPVAAAAAIQFAAGKHEAVFATHVYGEHIFLPVKVNNTDGAWFYFDSGAGMSIVSNVWAQKAGLAAEGTIGANGTGAGTASMRLAKDVVLEAPGARVPPATVAVWDLSPMQALTGREWDGILGYDIISKVVVRVDYEHERIAFYDPSTFAAAPGAAVLPVSFGQGLSNLVTVQGRILLPGRAPVDARCVIDTGADGFHLTTPFTNANHVVESIEKKILASTIGAGGESKEFAGRIASLQLGPYVLREPVTAFSPDEKQGLLASADIDAVIGGEILQRFTVTFDLPHRRILLEPNSHFVGPFRENETGLSLLAKGADFHRFEVDAVEAGSPAEAASIQKGDVLTRIGNHPAGELDLAKIDDLFREAGRTVSIIIQRQNRIVHTTLKLKERI